NSYLTYQGELYSQIGVTGQVLAQNTNQKKHLSNLKNIIFSNETPTTISGITPLHEEQTPNHHNSGNTLLFADIRDSF
ncbi:hypothetical protein, partial [uncultured Duncaniella sp.]|uniref:hypothetical protein n=1 Tax=uncultured Duncaniella sp. TaxID=2768039 RepID=UPI00266EB7AA